MERTGNGPHKWCFGNFTLGDEKCNTCLERAACLDDQEGWGKYATASDVERTAMIEDTLGGVPDWVFEWDELSEAELNRLEIEDPERFRIYSQLNSGIQD